jgi:retron-type reverse transcriptase
VNNNVGFRPALPPSQKSGLYGGLSSAEGKRSRIPSLPEGGENINRHGRLVCQRPNIVHAVFFGETMPQTIHIPWEKIVDFENVYRGYLEAAKGKRFYGAILSFKKNLEENIFTIIQELNEKTYAPSPFRQYYIHEPKRRLISAPAFRDRVVNHSLVRVIEPSFERRFVTETYACRVGRGTHASAKHVFHCAQIARHQLGKYFVLKGDVSDFFASVNHTVIKRLVRRSIRGKRVLDFVDFLIDSYSTDGRDNVGLPIGALLSQLLANVCLDPLDHFLKEKYQIKHYARYMDDFVVIHKSKTFLKELLTDIDRFLKETLSLRLNPKTAIYPGKHGIDFCGYRIWPTHIKPRKSTVKRAKKRLRKFSKLYPENPGVLEHAKMSIMSFFGYIKHCSGYKTTLAVLRRAVFRKANR